MLIYDKGRFRSAFDLCLRLRRQGRVLGQCDTRQRHRWSRDGRPVWSSSIRWQRNLVLLVFGPRRPEIQGMDRRRREFQLNVVRSRRRSVAGSLIVLKNNFAGTQAAEMGEDPPLTYFCRSRGTCDITSARSKQRRRGGTTEVARELQFHVNNLVPLVAVCPAPRE